jgi:putative endonuclease
MDYYVYILECVDKSLYTGITNNLDKRVHTHNTSNLGAKYTRGRRPVTLKYFEKCGTKGDALKREVVIKKLTRFEKIKLFKK